MFLLLDVMISLFAHSQLSGKPSSQTKSIHNGHFFENENGNAFCKSTNLNNSKFAKIIGFNMFIIILYTFLGCVVQLD